MTNAEITFEVHVQKLFSATSLKARNWYATLKVGTLSKETKSMTPDSDGVIAWDEKFSFTFPAGDRPSHKLDLALYRTRAIHSSKKVADADIPDLVKVSQTKTLTLNLNSISSKKQKEHYGQLIVQVRVILPDIGLAIARTRCQLFGQLGKVSSVPESWERFLSALSQAVELARQISELDSAAKVAVGVISFALKAVVDQIERDHRVAELREMMTSLLLFFDDVKSLRRNSFLCNVLERALYQVSRCTYFILQYEEVESFVQRTAAHLVSNTDAMLNQFFSSFASLTAELALGTSLQTTINTELILSKVNKIDVDSQINLLSRLDGIAWKPNKQCPPVVRDFTINRIHRWISSLKPGLFVLAGPPGSGKSAILHVIAETLEKGGHLGAGIFLDEDTEGKKTAGLLLRTVVYYLAQSHPRLGRRIASEISKQRSLESANAIRYRDLLQDISREPVLYEPLVVIVDGLHELMTQQDQELVENIFTEVAANSCSMIRFIISARRKGAAHQQASVYLEIGMPASLCSSSDFSSESKNPVTGMLDGVLINYPITKFADLSDSISLAGYDLHDLISSLHKHSLGSLQWLSLVRGFIDSAPQATRSFLDELLLTPSLVPHTEEEAIRRVEDAQLKSLPLNVLDHDLLRAPSGSRLFISKATELLHMPNKLLHQYDILQAEPNSRVHGMQEYDLNIPQSLPGFPGSHGTPLLPISDSPLNIYQISLRDASEDGQRPVYSRIALPVGEPLVDGMDIQNGFGLYGVGSWAIDRMLANSPLEGCEWIILHHKLFKSETKDRFTSVMATTPVMTQAILERLVCVWVRWPDQEEEGSSCMRLRDGKEETGFLARGNFNKAVYHGTHSELFKGGEKRGDLRPDDQLQVRAKYAERWAYKFAVIAMALKY